MAKVVERRKLNFWEELYLPAIVLCWAVWELVRRETIQTENEAKGD